MKNIHKIFAVILLFLASAPGANAQKNFLFEPNATVIVNDSVVIRLNDYEGTIQWQKSLDLETWEIIPDAIYDTLLFVADTTSYFRAEVIAGICEPFYSDTTLILVMESGVTDIDGNFYPSVIIGNQEWMAENLKTTKYRNGTPIDYPGTDNTAWGNNTTGAYAWYNNDIAWKDSYGALYNWHAVNNSNGLCPTGWHLPSHDEWSQLEQYICNQLGNVNCETQFPYDNYTSGWRGTNEGNALKSCRQVSSPQGGDCATSEHPRWNAHHTHYGTDDFGFSALPGGFRNTNGAYNGLGNVGYWWSSSELSSILAWYRFLYSPNGNIFRSYTTMGLGLSVRCVRDN